MLNAYDVSAKWVCFSPFVSLVFLCAFFCFLFFFFSFKKESYGGGRRLEKPAGKCSPATAALEQKRAEHCVTTHPLCTVCGQGLWPRGPRESREIPQKAHLLGSPWLHYSWIWGNFMEKTLSIHVDRCLGWAQWGARVGTGWGLEQQELLLWLLHLAAQGCLMEKLSHCFFLWKRFYFHRSKTNCLLDLPSALHLNRNTAFNTSRTFMQSFIFLSKKLWRVGGLPHYCWYFQHTASCMVTLCTTTTTHHLLISLFIFYLGGKRRKKRKKKKWSNFFLLASRASNCGVKNGNSWKSSEIIFLLLFYFIFKEIKCSASCFYSRELFTLDSAKAFANVQTGVFLVILSQRV